MDSRSKIMVVMMTILPALLQSLTTANEVAGIPAETEKMFVDVCSKSDNPKSCLNTLSHNPKASSAKDIRSVAEVALAAVSQESRNAQGVLRQAQQSNPKAGEALKNCMSYFDDTLKDLVIRDGDLNAGMATLNVHYALDSVGRCETALANGKFTIATVNGEIRQWKDIFNVAYYAVTQAEDTASGM